MRFLSRVLAPASHPRAVAPPLALAAAGLAVTCLLPGIYVWSSANSFIGPLGTPHVAAYSDEYLESCWRRSVEAVAALAAGYWPPSHVNRPDRPRWDLKARESGGP